jgi:hypothetical protein
VVGPVVTSRRATSRQWCGEDMLTYFTGCIRNGERQAAHIPAKWTPVRR